MQDKARGDSDQNETAHIFWMAQGIFGGNGTAEGVPYEVKRFLNLQRIHEQFHVIHHALHAISKRFRVIAQPMSTQIWCNDAHKLPKEAQLVDPLQPVTSISVDEDERACGILPGRVESCLGGW